MNVISTQHKNIFQWILFSGQVLKLRPLMIRFIHVNACSPWKYNLKMSSYLSPNFKFSIEVDPFLFISELNRVKFCNWFYMLIHSDFLFESNVDNTCWMLSYKRCIEKCRVLCIEWNGNQWDNKTFCYDLIPVWHAAFPSFFKCPAG